MTEAAKVTTDVACRIVGINPLRLNEHVAAGRFPCMPATIRGRYRLFDIYDVLSLWLFHEYLDEGQRPKNAGSLACKIANLARDNPSEATISVVRSIIGTVSVHLAKDVPTPDEWGRIYFSGLPIYKVTNYNIDHLREVILNKIEEEIKVDGNED